MKIRRFYSNHLILYNLNRIIMKSKIFLVLFILTLNALNLRAQNLSLRWTQQFGGSGWDYVNTMVRNTSGSYILGGSMKGVLSTDTTHEELYYSNNAFLASCDTNGNILWQKTFGGIMFDNITSLSKTHQGILISGIFQDSIFFGSLKSFTPAYTGGYSALVDTLGSPIWLNRYGGLATISQILNCSSPLGTSFIAGVFTDSLQLTGQPLSRTGERGIFISKLLPDGSEANPFIIRATGKCNLGGISCNDSLLCIAGSFSDTLQLADTTLISIGEEDVFIALFSHEGALMQVIIAGGMGNEHVRSVLLSPEGEIGITGWFDYAFLMDNKIVTSNGGKDLFIAVLDTAFNVKWLKNIGGQGDDYGYAICKNSRNEYFVSGNFVHNMNIPDENGNLIEYDASNAFGNAFVAKISSKGELKASYNLPATSEDFCKTLIVDDNGFITAAGNFYQKMNLQGIGEFNDSLVSAGERDIFILRFLDLCENFNVNAGIDTALCPGQTIELSVPDNIQYYRWMPSGMPNQNFDVQLPGTYTLLVTDINGCIASDTIVITTKLLPEIHAGSDTTLHAEDVLVLSQANSQSTNQVEWNSTGTGHFSNYNVTNTNYAPSYDDISQGIIMLVLSGTNHCGMIADSLQLTIEQDSDGITAFPNPTTGMVTFVCTEGVSIINATISTQAGNVIQSEIPINNTIMQFDLTPYPPGSYLFHLITPNAIVAKIINKI